MRTSMMDKLWSMHDETKRLVLLDPRQWLKQAQIHLSNGNQERDVDLADELSEAPAEHRDRLRTSPGGVEEGDPRGYTKRQKLGLILGPVLFILMLLIPTPTGMEPAAQKMAAIALLMATW